MIKIGVVSNPASTRNKGEMGGIRAALRGRQDVSHVELSSIADISPVMADFARREVGLVVVNGGDGTLQAVLTELFNEGPFGTVPPIAVLPGGMSNMIAHDVGVTGDRADALARLGLLGRSGEIRRFVVSRRLIRMDGTLAARPQFGMFLATAALYEMTIANRRLHAAGIRDPFAVAITLGRIVARRLLRGNRADPFFEGRPIAVDLDGERVFDASSFLLIVTTLDRALLNFRPFWGTGTGPLHWTNVAGPPPRLLRFLPRLLYGRVDGPLPPEYMSENADTISLRMDCPLTLDGEIFTPRAATPVVLSGESTARFVRLPRNIRA